jgi:hypothetical protein
VSEPEYEWRFSIFGRSEVAGESRGDPTTDVLLLLSFLLVDWGMAGPKNMVAELWCRLRGTAAMRSLVWLLEVRVRDLLD